MGLNGVTLTQGVATSLVALRKTSQQLDQVNEHLLTGKYMPLDNPK